MCGGFGNSTLTNGYIKLGNMYQEAQHFKAAVHCYNEAIRLSSDNPLDSAHCYHLLAVLSSVTRQHKGALEFEQRGYKILKTLLGPDSPRTKQAFSWVKKFTQNVVCKHQRGRCQLRNTRFSSFFRCFLRIFRKRYSQRTRNSLIFSSRSQI